MPDIAADPSTRASLAPGDSLTSRLGGRGDTDWVRIELSAGDTVRITLDGRGTDPVNDPFLSVYGAKGRLLEFSDDGPRGLGSDLLFTAQKTGTYYLEAGAYRARDTGTYRLAVETALPPDDPLAALDWGGERVDSHEISVRFLPDGVRDGAYTSEGFNAYEIARFHEAFARIEAVANVTFVITDAADADFRLILDTDEVGGEFLGFFNPPGERGAGRGVFDGTRWLRDPDGAAGDLDAGGYAFVTVTHELLHGLGLAHPHDNGGGSEVLWQVSREKRDYGAFDLNQGVFTTMSYNTGYLTGPEGTQGDPGDFWGYEAGPMALDIAVLQAKYGANTETATGDDRYVLPRDNAAGTGWQALWDAGGSDTILHRGAADCVIDLRPASLDYAAGGGGFVSAVAGIAGGVTIAAGTVIEAATGGRGNDVLTGNGAANRLEGRGGADILTGGGGGDRLIGGRGADVFVLSDPGDSRGGAGRDTIADFGTGRDRIDLSRLDADEGRAGDQAFVVIGGARFSDTAGELRLLSRDGGTLALGDTDGDGRADLRLLVAGAEPGTGLEAGDFLL